MPAPLVYDASRLCTRALNPTPNGIDRLDALLARGLLADGSAAALAFGAAGPRLIEARAAIAALDRAERSWRERQAPERDAAALAALRDALAGRAADRHAPARRPAPALRRLASALRTLAELGLAGGPDPERGVPRGACYFNASHFPLERPRHVAWLGRRPDVRPVMLVHDLLPLDHPEWFWTGEPGRHRARLALLASRGAGAVVTSAAVEGRLRSEMARLGRADFPVLRAAPPVAPAFHAPPLPDPGLAAARFFVSCGTVEPRKNHALLLRVWRRLAAERGTAAPKLVVVGKRGWRCDGILAEMHALAARGHLVHARGLPSGAYRALLDASLGLLAPSWAEGYGLPVAEALARGVPVLASDIPAFRERAPGLLLDPGDDDAWHDAVAALADAPPRRSAPVGGVAEAGYLDAVRGFLAGLA